MRKLISLILFLLIPVIAQTQVVVQEWEAIYSGPNPPGDQPDIATAIAVDNDGNVYVTGYSFAVGTNRDYATIKYNPQGVMQWVSRYTGPITGINGIDEPLAIAVDNSGNVYVTGFSVGNELNNDYLTIKYNSNGVEQWVARFNSTFNQADIARDIAVDANGNVYVTGSSSAGFNNNDIVTIKYFSDGTMAWLHRFNGLGSMNDVAEAIKVDASGNVYVTGFSINASSISAYITLKYDGLTGLPLWASSYTNGIGEHAYDLALDNSGNVYVTGTSFGTGLDYATVMYNNSGVQQWVARYNGPGNGEDIARAIEVDQDGNIYVTGESTGAGTGRDYATIKYNNAGVQQWVSRYNGPISFFDGAKDLALDSDGNVYVTGRSEGIIWGQDYATVKYNNDGVQQWVMRYNGNWGDCIANAVAVDNDGNVYVTGQGSQEFTGADYVTIKYSQNSPNFGTNGQTGDNLYFFANSTIGASGSNTQPVFNWRNTASATILCENGVNLVGAVNVGGLDNGRFELMNILPPGHSIKFFGIDYTNLYVSTNGVISLSANTADAVPAGLPNASVPIAIIPLWMDFNLAYTNFANRLSYEVTSNEIILTWYRISPKTNAGTIGDFPELYTSVQVVISHSNTPTQNSSILFQYSFDESGIDFRNAYFNDGLAAYPHLIGLQGSNTSEQAITYRNRHNTLFTGPIFGSNLALAFAADDNSLPVDLISFSANVSDNDVTLSWITTWEENNMRFDVQRRPVILSPTPSGEESPWTTIGSVAGSGTTYEQRNYSYTDRNLATGNYEYRLVQFNYDGNSTADFNLSQTVEVGIPSTFALAQNYPNPFNPTTKIDFQIPVEGFVKLSVFDMSGREVATLVNEALTPGYYTYDFNGSNLSSGAYFYRLVTNNSVITKKMMLVK